ncbi:MAG TPA: adenosylmethionine--8-amino-7-oxononanoate transaminase [Gammaproteobacteria bacterium]|nr:adenosylmethionine--8-amino-7-oxononanoate transaminase [Gammaproteobacteria bacterium]
MSARRDANAELVARDLARVWHPCTQMKDHEWLPLVPIRRGAGAWLEDFNGRRYLDAISSWWVNLFGHANPVIGNAVRRQLETLEHVMLAGFTHEPVVELSERLVAVTPAGLERCFYADNGSSAVEVALKMSFHYWLNQGESKRKRFVALENSYHGETLGALAVGDVALYKDTYRPLLMDCLLAPSPDAWLREAGESPAGFGRRRAAELEALLERHPGEVCAVIVEPLVQCAGSMRMHDAAFLTELRAVCDRHRVHLIADEIAVGFGRTGTMFACEQAGIAPDFLCLSKGLTGGYLPLSVVLTSNAVYDAFYDDYATLRAFLHSHSYTGNPLACAAALATLDLFAASDVLAGNRARAAQMRAGVAELEDHPHVGEIRQAGMILAIEMVEDRASRRPYRWQERRGLKVYQHGLASGVLLRPLGPVVYFMPPYVVDEEDIALMTRTAVEGVRLATEAD